MTQTVKKVCPLAVTMVTRVQEKSRSAMETNNVQERQQVKKKEWEVLAVCLALTGCVNFVKFKRSLFCYVVSTVTLSAILKDYL